MVAETVRLWTAAEGHSTLKLKAHGTEQCAVCQLKSRRSKQRGEQFITAASQFRHWSCVYRCWCLCWHKRWVCARCISSWVVTTRSDASEWRKFSSKMLQKIHHGARGAVSQHRHAVWWLLICSEETATDTLSAGSEIRYDGGHDEMSWGLKR